jgi:hypothetical protein
MAAASRLAGAQQPSAAFSLAPVRVPWHARVAGCRRSRLMSRGSGCRQHPGHPAQRSGIDCCAGVASLLMNARRLNARRHPSEAQPGPKCFVRRRQLREHRLCHGPPGTTGAGNAIVTERGHMTRSQPEFGRITPIRNSYLWIGIPNRGAQKTALCADGAPTASGLTSLRQKSSNLCKRRSQQTFGHALGIGTMLVTTVPAPGPARGTRAAGRCPLR